MTLTEYYRILAESWAAVDQNDRAQIHNYKETARELRKLWTRARMNEHGDDSKEE